MVIEQPTDEAGRRAPAVGRQVRRWRTDRGLTLARLAQATGLNIGYLSQIENDKAGRPSRRSSGPRTDAGGRCRTAGQVGSMLGARATSRSSRRSRSRG